MQLFESKKSILEYCGKNEKDVRRLDRAIKSGKVGIYDGAYYLVKEYIKDLEEENKKLKNQNTNRSSDIKQSEDSNEVKELRRHLNCVFRLNENKKDCLRKMAESFYKKHQGEYGYDEAIEKFYSVVGYTEDPIEKDEIEWAKDNNLL